MEAEKKPNQNRPEKCRVPRCSRDAEVIWEPLVQRGGKVPVCWKHFRCNCLKWVHGRVYELEAGRGE